MAPGKSKQRAPRESYVRELTQPRSSSIAPAQNSSRGRKAQTPSRTVLAGIAAAIAFASPAAAKAPASKTWKTATAAHIRSAPSSRSPVVALTPRNALVASANCATAWCAVEYNGKRGWIYKAILVEAAAKPARAPVLPERPAAIEASLKLAPAPDDPPAPVAPEEVTGVSYSLIGLGAEGFLPIREGPLDSARVLGVLSSSAADIADLKTSVRQWRLIEHNGVKGYVQGRYLARAAEAAPQRYQIEGTGSLKVFNFGGADAEIVGEIPFYAGGIVPIGECNAEWCHIRYLGLVGFVDKRGLRAEAGPES
jgi:SH3-like domain-containing protein